MLIVPVRHHSPAAALQVGRLIRERRPRVVLIEGPADATPLIEQLLDPATVPPVALYAYLRRGDDVRAAFYPFCAYSPEYVALQAGREVGAELQFCDLPAGAALTWEERPTTQPPGDLTPQPPLRRGEGEETGVSNSPLAGGGYGAYTAALADAAGFDSFEAFWEAAFEQEAGGQPPDGYVELMATFGGQARTLTSGRDSAFDDQRERAMAAAAHACLERGIPDDAIMLVCGAAHAGAIAAAYAEMTPTPLTPRPPLPRAGEGGGG